MRHRNPLPLIVPALAFVAFFLTVPVHAQFGDLVRRIPDGANTIVLVDVDQLLNSPIAKKEDWRNRQAIAFQSGLLMIPPKASQFVVAAKLDFATMEPDWQVALMRTNYEPDILGFALQYQGSIDKIGGRSIAIIPGDLYAVQFGPRVGAIGAPANRQDVTRWIRRIDNGSLRGLSPYLTEAQKFAQSTSPFIMAIDLTDALPVAEIRRRLEESDVLQGKDLDLDVASSVIASIRGVTLGVTFGEVRTGSIKVDFSEDITPIKDYAQPILLGALAFNGLMIDEFAEWEVRVGDKQLQIIGELQPSGMRRILSLLDPPMQLQGSPAPPANSNDPQSQEQLATLASQQYFKSIVSLLDDLRKDKSNRKTMGQIGVFFGKYAHQIDRLSMVHVDPALLDYSKFVSESLRYGQSSVQGAAVRSRVRQQQVPEQYDIRTYSVPVGATRFRSYSWNGWSATSNPRRTSNLRTQVRTQERLTGVMSANEVLQSIDNATSDVRRVMTQKYNVDF